MIYLANLTFFIKNIFLWKQYKTHSQSGNVPTDTKMGLSLVLIFMLTISFMIIEFFSSIITHSLTLLADSFHMTTDVIALFLSLIAMWVARKPRDSVHSYGFKRAEVLAAFLNGIFFIIISIY